MNVSIQLKVKSFIRDPNDTDLGRKIIENSILLIDQLGFEAFTFKKLASIIDSTEASVYRYFENKHKLLIYLISWYWSWLEYRLNVEFLKVHKPEQKLDFFLKVITTPGNVDSEFKFVNGVALHRIVVSESPKAFLTKDVDADNKDG